jgi:hypothetical protein
MFELLVTHSVHIPLRLLAMAPAHGSSTTRLPHLWVSCCLLVAGTACAVTMSELDMQHMVAARAERGCWAVAGAVRSAGMAPSFLG